MNNFIGKIEDIKIVAEEGKVYFTGYSFIEDINISKSNNVKKSLIISKGDIKYYVPTENIFRNDITEKFGNGEHNYDYAGFCGFIDVGFIDNKKPLDTGLWKLSIYIDAAGVELECEIGYDESLKEVDSNELKILFIKSKKIIEVKLINHCIFIQSDNRVFLDDDDKKIPVNKEKKHKKKHKNLKRYIGNIVFQTLYKIEKNFKVKENRVTFLSDSRVDLTGNFEFVYKELVSRGGYDIKHILKARIDAKKTLKEKLDFIYYISTSKYIILDDYYPQIYKYDIKEEIEVIQLWHACGAFKTFGFSRLGKVGGPSSRSKNHKNYTKAIVSSEDIRKHYAEAFGISEEKVIATGVPRTDIFFDEEYKDTRIKELYDKYPKLKNKKTILFAPTFRGSGQGTAHYNFDKLNINKMRQALGNEYIMIMKLHPFIKDSITITEENSDFIIDLSNEREINDLLFISDIMITDYSSVCFEYSLLNKPMIFFTYDLEEYIESRDFYYPFETFVPGPIVRSTDEIIDIITNNNFDLKRVEEFKNKFFSNLDGKSTKRVVDMLINIPNSK